MAIRLLVQQIPFIGATECLHLDYFIPSKQAIRMDAGSGGGLLLFLFIRDRGWTSLNFCVSTIGLMSLVGSAFSR